jgi:hypothetical protein
MLLFVLALALLAGLRGRLRLPFIALGNVSYETSLDRFGIGMTADSLLEYAVAVTFGTMALFEGSQAGAAPRTRSRRRPAAPGNGRAA